MREELKLKNMEEKIEIWESMRNAILENETKEIYLPVMGEDMYWHLVGNRIIVIQETLANKILSVSFITEKEFNRVKYVPITIVVEDIDGTIEFYADSLYEKINALKHECDRIRRKLNNKKAV